MFAQVCTKYNTNLKIIAQYNKNHKPSAHKRLLFTPPPLQVQPVIPANAGIQALHIGLKGQAQNDGLGCDL
jgi:hypothetical protein